MHRLKNPVHDGNWFNSYNLWTGLICMEFFSGRLRTLFISYTLDYYQYQYTVLCGCPTQPSCCKACYYHTQSALLFDQHSTAPVPLFPSQRELLGTVRLVPRHDNAYCCYLCVVSVTYSTLLSAARVSCACWPTTCSTLYYCITASVSVHIIVVLLNSLTILNPQYCIQFVIYLKLCT